MQHHQWDELTEEQLRFRQSAKWRVYPADVLPLWVAEMDYPLAPAIKRAVQSAMDHEDFGYADPRGLGEAFSTFAATQWHWSVEPVDTHVVVDVVTALEALLEVLTAPGDSVVIDPPVYPPFAGTVKARGRNLLACPLLSGPDGFSLNLAAIEAAYAAGAKVHFLCSPQNPTGTVYTRAELTQLVELATKYAVVLLSDEIHAPLTHTAGGRAHIPLTSLSDAAKSCAIVLTSATKTWNIAGLKAAVIVAQSAAMRAVCAKLPEELPYHAGHLGILGTRAAYTECSEWHASALQILARNRLLVAELVATHLPGVRYAPPMAGYLAWLDFSATALALDPQRFFLKEARVALSGGPSFGTPGERHARLNFATTATMLKLAFERMGAAFRSHLAREYS
jgi:cysteine-S-conjugate beta-lyase